ncbi:MAG TPA: hypothetical protein VI837_06970 [Blastocatellia bacterium]|nr:hypothetical protein [Blastocatellia bacterium]
MVFAIDHLIQAREFPQRKSGGRHRGLLSALARSVPVQIHLLPLDEVTQDVLDRPTPVRHARLGHETRWNDGQALVQCRTLLLDLGEELLLA